MINTVCLMALTIVAAGFAVRILMYARTGNAAYKHDLFVWWNHDK